MHEIYSIQLQLIFVHTAATKDPAKKKLEEFSKFPSIYELYANITFHVRVRDFQCASIYQIPPYIYRVRMYKRIYSYKERTCNNFTKLTKSLNAEIFSFSLFEYSLCEIMKKLK